MARRRRGGGQDGGGAAVALLRARLREAEETLRAIRGGDVDAIVVYGAAGERVYTLHGAEHSYRVLVEAMREGAATVAVDGTILYCNRSFAELVGRDVEAVMGTPLASHVSPGHVPALRELLDRATSDAARRELALRGPEGKPLPVLLSASAMQVDGQALLCLVVTDLSEVGRLQDAVRARDEFLSIASHELKTPITALALYLDALLRRREGEPEAAPALRDRVEGARRQVRRLTHLVNDLLDVSRLSAGRLDLDLQQVDLAALVREVVERHRREALAAGCAVEVAAPSPVVGLWDRSRLDQVATNLLSNAIKYGKGRPIRIEVGAEGGRARLAVTDHGVGVDPADHERIFQRFERAASPHDFGGLGLGLWIVREILVRVGGTVRVDSRAGAGACFVVELPQGAADAAAGSAA